jgi:hypothetical protein
MIPVSPVMYINPTILQHTFFAGVPSVTIEDVVAGVYNFGPQNRTDRAVLLFLAGYPHGSNLPPTLGRIARMVCHSERTVRLSVARLAADGWLRVDFADRFGYPREAEYIFEPGRLKRNGIYIHDSLGD